MWKRNDGAVTMSSGVSLCSVITKQIKPSHLYKAHEVPHVILVWLSITYFFFYQTYWWHHDDSFYRRNIRSGEFELLACSVAFGVSFKHFQWDETRGAHTLTEVPWLCFELLRRQHSFKASAVQSVRQEVGLSPGRWVTSAPQSHSNPYLPLNPTCHLPHHFSF